MLAHSPRGTTSPSSATATPRPPGSTPGLAHGVATVAPSEQLARLAVDAHRGHAGTSVEREARGAEAGRHLGQPPAGQQAGHRLARQRREQHAVAPVAGGPHEPVAGRPSPMTGRLSGVPGRRPATARTQLELVGLRAAPPRRAPAGGGRRRRSRSCRSPAPPPSRRAPRARRRGPRGSSAACARSGRAARRRGRARSSRICPFTGRTGRSAPGRARRTRRPPPPPRARSSIAPARSLTPVTRSPSCSIAVHLEPVRHLIGRLGERERGRARVGLRVPGGEHAAGDPRGQPGLELAAARRREPLAVEPERRVQLVQAAELLDVVAVGGHHQRAALAEAGRAAGLLLEPRSERRPALAAREAEPQPGLLAEVRLGDRGEHAGGHARGAGPGLARALDHEHATGRAGRRSRRRRDR